MGLAREGLRETLYCLAELGKHSNLGYPVAIERVRRPVITTRKLFTHNLDHYIRTKYRHDQAIDYELSSEDDSTSFPLPFDITGGLLPADLDGAGAEVVFASCHDGMDGLPVKAGNDVEEELVRALGPRLSRSALSDLSSC